MRGTAFYQALMSRHLKVLVANWGCKLRRAFQIMILCAPLCHRTTIQRYAQCSRLIIENTVRTREWGGRTWPVTIVLDACRLSITFLLYTALTQLPPPFQSACEHNPQSPYPDILERRRNACRCLLCRCLLLRPIKSTLSFRANVAVLEGS